MTPDRALQVVIDNITTNGIGAITGAVMRGVLDDIIALDDSPGAVKSAVKVATTAAITLSGAQTIDGVSVVANDRVLVKDQASPIDNGIYVAAGGAWTRAVNFNADATVSQGSMVYVNQGSTYAQTLWAQDTANPIVGTTALTFSRVSGGLSRCDIGFFAESALSNGETFGRYVFPVAVSFAGTGSQAKAATPATGSTVISIGKNGVSFGTITFAASGTSGTFGGTLPATFDVGDVLTLTGPNPADATLAQLAITLVCTL